jgi:hypothetical protein
MGNFGLSFDSRMPQGILIGHDRVLKTLSKRGEEKRSGFAVMMPENIPTSRDPTTVVKPIKVGASRVGTKLA